MANSTKKSASKKSAATTAKKSVKKETATRTFIDKAMRIIKLVKENPRRKGTFGFKSFQKIKNGMTVEQFQEAGGRLKDLHWDVNHDYLKLEKNRNKAA